MRVKVSGKTGLNFNIKNTTIVASAPIISNRKGGKGQVVTDFVSLGSEITEDHDCSNEILKNACSLEEKL